MYLGANQLVEKKITFFLNNSFESTHVYDDLGDFVVGEVKHFIFKR